MHVNYISIKMFLLLKMINKQLSLVTNLSELSHILVIYTHFYMYAKYTYN